MLHYIIDGWNIIHKIPEVKKSAAPRQEFIWHIRRQNLTGSGNNKVTVVFDGGPHYDEFLEEKEYSVVFSLEESADEVIKRRISRAVNKKQLVIVTDDREIIYHARAEGAQFVRSKEFLTPKKKRPPARRDYQPKKRISAKLEAEITEELRKKWLKEDEQ